MAAIVPTLADFRAQFPELSAKTDAQVNLWLGQSDPFFDQGRWDDMLFIGMLYWVAHQLVVVTANAGTQLIDDSVMKKVGDIAKSRDPTLILKLAQNPYLRTAYGQQYLDYQRLVGIGGFAV